MHDMTEEFTFLDPGCLIDGDLELVLVKTSPADAERELVPEYKFEMVLVDTRKGIGTIGLRIGNVDKIKKYGGHIAYAVQPEHRGHRYAARSCKLLFPFAKRNGLQTIWITCNPDNIASRRTCEIAGGTFVDIVDLPEDNDMYQEGERQKCRFRFDL